MKKITAILLILAIAFSLVNVGGFANLEEEKEKLNNLKEKIQENEGQLEAAKDEHNSVSSSIQDVIANKRQLEDNIKTTEADIVTKEGELETIRKNLEKALAEINKQQAEFGDRLSVMYLNQNSESILSILLKSESIKDFFVKLAYFKEIAHQDEKILKELNAQRDVIAELEAVEKKNYDQLVVLKNQLEKDKEALVVVEAELEARKGELEEMIAEYERQGEQMNAEAGVISANIDGMIAAAQQQREAEARRAAAQAAQQAAAEANTEGEEGEGSSENSGGETSDDYVPSRDYTDSSGMMWPVPGVSLITEYYGDATDPFTGAYRWHNGLDIAGPYGTPIVAAKGGLVIMADYYGGYGQCIIIDHGDGTQTLYAHGQAMYVGVGEEVSKGQTIMAMGSTGYSSGSHLHFSVIVGGNFVDPLGYI